MLVAANVEFAAQFKARRYVGSYVQRLPTLGSQVGKLGRLDRTI